MLKLVIISILLLLALASDLKSFRIKNSITYSFMLAGIISNTAVKGMSGAAFSIKGIILPAVCMVILYILRIIGAGDIKLISAIGAVMGAGFALHTAVYSFICGGFIALLLILLRRNGIERFRYLFLYIKSCLISAQLLDYVDFENHQDSGKFHFSTAVALGTAALIITERMGISII